MLAIFSIVPIGSRSGPRWDGARFFGEVLVRAFSAADARSIASIAPSIGSDHFLDETLYRVVEVNYGEAFLAAGPRGLIVSLPGRK